MNKWNDLRDPELRRELLEEDKYFTVGTSLTNGTTLRADALVIDLEFAKTLNGDIEKILKELGVTI